MEHLHGNLFLALTKSWVHPASSWSLHGSRVVVKMTKQGQFPLYRLENPPRIGPRVTRVQGARSFHEVYVLLLLHWDRERQIENWCL